MLLLSLSFCRWTEPMLRTFFLHLRMADDDGGFRCNVIFS